MNNNHIMITRSKKIDISNNPNNDIEDEEIDVVGSSLSNFSCVMNSLIISKVRKFSGEAKYHLVPSSSFGGMIVPTSRSIFLYLHAVGFEIPSSFDSSSNVLGLRFSI